MTSPRPHGRDAAPPPGWRSGADALAGRTRAALLRALPALAAGAAPGEALHAIDAALRDLPAADPAPPPLPPAVVARPCWQTALRSHLERLAAALGDPAPPAAGPIRAAYHARWAWHAVAPEDPASAPRISIVIPVHDRAARLAEAVASCVAQSYAPAEIIVVDDGSREDPAPALARFGAAVTLLRHADNRGVAAARNRGLARATGDYVHFLDSDDLLAEDALAAKIAALRIVADADICYADFGETDEHGRPRPPRVRPIEPNDPASPVWATRNLVRQHGFLIGTVMIARHVLAEVGPFDEWLPNVEDTRYWQRLGRHTAKIIAVDRALLTRRLLPDSLSQNPVGRRPWGDGVTLMGAVDCLADPATWRDAWLQIDAHMGKPSWAAIRDADESFAAPFRAYVLERVRDLPALAAACGLSARPLAAVLGKVIRGRIGGAPSAFERALLESVDAGARTGPPPDARDVQFWLSRPLLSKEMAALLVAAGGDASPLPPAHRRAVRFARIAVPAIGPSIPRRLIALALRPRSRRSGYRRGAGLRAAALLAALALAAAMLGWPEALRMVLWAAGAAMALAAAGIVALRFVLAPPTPRLIRRRLSGRRDARQPLRLAAIAPALRDAVVAAEDPRFAAHRGVDWTALHEAFDDYLRGARPRGASTITMQLARNVFLWRGRSLLRKVLEIAFAYAIEAVLTKPRILEIYLNVAEWGDGITGAGAAARSAFAKPAGALDLSEAALLAAALPNPLRRDPARPSADLSRLAHQIARRVERMRADGTAFTAIQNR